MPCTAGVKYDVKVTRTASQAFRLHMGNNFVDIVGRKLNDGGLLIQVCPPDCMTLLPHLFQRSTTHDMLS